MNPNDARIVRVTNISNFDFTPERGAMYDSRPFYLRAGDSQLFPYPIGDHLATHLARQIMLNDAPIRDEKELDGRGKDRPLWDQTAETELKALIMKEEYQEAIPQPKTQTEILMEKVEELNNRLDQKDANSSEYKDKKEVIAELDKRGIQYDARKSKDELEKLL